MLVAFKIHPPPFLSFLLSTAKLALQQYRFDEYDVIQHTQGKTTIVANSYDLVMMHRTHIIGEQI